MENQIAGERIERLFDLAEKRLQEPNEGRQQLADRYVELARSIGMAHNVSIPADFRKRFCQNCNTYLKPGLNCRVVISSRDSVLEYRCGKCGNVNRYGF